MSRSRTRLWIGACSTLAVLAVAVVDLRRTAPGPLSAVHGREAELVGRRACSQCHGGWRGSMAEACLECHEEIASDVRGGGGLHGAIGREQVAACSRCHSEHHGDGFAMVNRRSFALAGVPDPGVFDHARVGFVLDGAHLQLECRRCHGNADVAVLPRGEPRFGGQTQDCGSCHEDAHQGRMQPACASCHGQQDWKELRSRGHDAFLPLIGGHAELGCRTCHAESGPHALERQADAGRFPLARDCADCHESPHAEAFTRETSRRAELPPDAGCAVCHAAEHSAFDDERLELTAEQHAASGFALDVPHAGLACVECHAPQEPLYAQRFPGRGRDDCGACHDDPHQGQFADGPFAEGGCLACHERERFEPHAFGLERHERAAFPLDGRHAELECAACHEVRGGGAARSFRGTPQGCVDCHVDAHRGFFEDHRLAHDGDEALTCAVCHGTSRFDGVEAGAFDHGLRTGFPVLGAHAQADCEACHPRDDEPDATGRRFGRVQERFGRFEGCVTCHADPHRGGFDGTEHPAEVDGRGDCARCHVETSFRAFPDGFEHVRWTGYALVGSHAQVSCSRCHAPLTQPDAGGRTWARAPGTACADCHVDVHRGQLAREGRTDCARCHAERSDFSALVFDHERDARFALGAAHAELACSACHVREETAAGDELVRYRPLPQGCSDCHGIHDQPLLRRRRGGR